jgi:serine phosphatase RsbU (regulator of sigma subunit)
MASKRAADFFERYTRDFTGADFQRLFTRDTPEAYRFFTRGIDFDKVAQEPWYRRWAIHTRLLFVAFTMRLWPARRVLYGVALILAALGLARLFSGFGPTSALLFPIMTVTLYLPHWVPGTVSLLFGFLLVNLLMLMEVADRLSLKSDLEIARDIQLAMLPRGVKTAGDARIFGATRPANTVGGDFYDILPLADGRVVVAVGDVAGKGSPAALLMALLLAMLRTLADEMLEPARMIERLNVQVARHSPASRFITLFYGIYDPRDGSLEYVNAGHLPPMVFHRAAELDRLEGGGLALGMFPAATYDSHRAIIQPGDVLVLYSDGITEADSAAGRAFEDTGLEAVITQTREADPEVLARAVLAAVDAHAGDVRLVDDLTVLILSRVGT